MTPLLLDTTGPALRHLHRALLVVLERGLVFSQDAGLRHQLSLELRVEVDQETLGPVTHRILAQLRIEHELPDHAGLDAPTADLILHLLERAGHAFDLESDPSESRLSRWRQRLESGVAEVQGAGERARERIEDAREGLERARDDLRGRTADRSDDNRGSKPRLPGREPQADTPGEQPATSGEVDAPTAEALNQPLAEVGLLDDEPRELIVYGTARHEDGRPVAGGRVRVEWLPGALLAGEGETDDAGCYRLTVTAPEDRPPLALRVLLFDAAGMPLAESPAVDHPQPVTLVEFVLPLAQGAAGLLKARVTRVDTPPTGGPGTRRLRIAGRVTDAATARPMPGQQVAAEAHARSESAETSSSASGPWEALGSATTGAEGGFGLILSDAALASGLVERMLASGGQIRFSVQAGEGELLQSDAWPLEADALMVELTVVIPREPLGGERWARVAAAIAEARIGRVNSLVASLATNASEGPFANWSSSERLAGLAELEAAFLDPSGTLRQLGSPLPTLPALQVPGALESYVQGLGPAAVEGPVRAALLDLAGKAAAFQRLDEVDWEMDTTSLERGDLGAALTQFQDDYRLRSDLSFSSLIVSNRSPGVQYRDYLREIWVSVAQIHREFSNSPTLTPQQAAQQLATRFHQDFHQAVVTELPANEVLIAIVTEILTAPAGDRWGFGLSAAALPARGTLTARDYLDKLIELSGLTATELGLRYRLDLQRNDAARSSPVQENIATLQAFFRDGFQSAADPVGADPDIHGKPVIPPSLQGKAPFFLWYDEWLRQQAPFFPENHFDFRRALPVRASDGIREAIPRIAGLKPAEPGTSVETDPKRKAEWKLINTVLEADALLTEGHKHFYAREYGLAAPSYMRARELLAGAVQEQRAKDFDIQAALAERRQIKVSKIDELDAAKVGWSGTFTDPGRWRIGYIDNIWSAREGLLANLMFRLHYWQLYVLPMIEGDLALALGDYQHSVFSYGQVTRLPIGVARESDAGGYRPHYLKETALYHEGGRPYTVNIGESAGLQYPLQGDTGQSDDTTTYSKIEEFAAYKLLLYIHPIERKAACIRQGNALLAWADALYRTSEPSSIQRARELYKAVLYLHGSPWPVSPTWPQTSDGMASFSKSTENPAVTAQKTRARAGIFKITSDLNWYGETDDIVPVMRYRALREVAERFASLARTAQQDFLLFTEKMEASMADRMRLANLMQKSLLQVKVGEEQAKIAEHSVSVAQAQVEAVNSQIKAKRKELEDSMDLFEQFSDFFKGMVKTFTSLPGGVLGFIKDGFKATAAGTGGLVAGLGVLGGYAAFVYGGYTSMSAMADEYKSLSDQIGALEKKALPAAQAQVRARQREVEIARYNQQITEADVRLARELLMFEERRFLGLEFWSELAGLMERLLERYLVIAARTAWLAERALAHELDRDIRIVRFDYFPERLQGVTGPDLLLADLAELEAVRVEGTMRSTPVRVTFSLAADHPLAFGRLKQTGACSFATTEAWLRAIYPGTSGYRVRAASATVVQTAALTPIRGVLVNEGVSILRPGSPDERSLVRPAEGMPISEFRLERDLTVQGLPDDVLFPFEGNGIETFWRIDLPLAGNALALSSVADVLVTFDLRARYDPSLHAAQAAQPGGTVRRWILMSAQRFAGPALEKLVSGQAATLAFDFAALGLSPKERNRTVTNLGFALVSARPLDVTATVTRANPLSSVNLTLKDGVAHSNVHPDPNASALPVMVLNALTGSTAEQIFSLTLDPAQNPGMDFGGLGDVLFAVEYSAQVGA